MPITINRHELTDAQVQAELPHHQDAANPLQAATTALVLQTVLLDEAERLGLLASPGEALPRQAAEAVIERLLESQVPQAVADEATCRRHYDAHPAHFTVGEQIEVSHILFQVTPDAKLDALRHIAQLVLTELQADPGLFAEKAKTLSNCPSGAVGGQLGRISRGETVPEFERAAFATPPGELCPRVVETRFGLHIIQTARHIEGQLLPFEAVQAQISQALSAAHQDRATRHYLQRLVSQAEVNGVELPALEGLLQ